ncbi:MAG: PIN domain-containing protein [Candidatus Heimdallarchaeota archaeon]
MRILIDTSAWIDFFRGVASHEKTLLKDCLSRREHIFIAGVIVQEILQGIRDDSQYRTIREFLFLFSKIDTQFADHVDAANIYRDLRKRGATIRSPVDCLIAALAIRHRLFLLHKDRDFTVIARHHPLSIVS